MGRRILALAHADSAFEIVGALEREGTDALGTDVGSLIGGKRLGVRVESDVDSALKQARVLIDFTQPSASETHLRGALRQGVGVVIGTTGLSEKTRQAVRRASRRIPILQSPNMSAGVNLLFELVTGAAKVLGDDYDIEISETHHRMKKDAPSGTALELARLIAEIKGWDPKKAFLYGRRGETGERRKGTITIHALRGGEVVGDHTVSFLGNGEVLELTHRATSRDAFARGALLAAKFVAAKRSGLYNMRDVLRG
jgi:4-hydroxy-tetrahydrodipicolinate reductase